MKFYDTNALLELCEKNMIQDKFLISSISLTELENIKTNIHKDLLTKYKARRAIHFLEEFPEAYDVFVYGEDELEILNEYHLEINPDNKICASAKLAEILGKDIIFITNDICCKIIAEKIFNLKTEQAYSLDLNDHYKGFIEKIMAEEEMASFYSNLNVNYYGLKQNEYLIIKNSNNELVDKFKWDGLTYTPVKIPTVRSDIFGTVKPYQGDVYQQLLLNSFATNQLTMVKGTAGTGKSYLALGYLFSLLDSHKIEKIIIFCNTVCTANSAKLGFYPGTRNEKLLDSSIGNMLSAKLGGIYGVEQLVGQGKIELIPMSDIRGYDTSEMKAGVYITEAQNMDISLMKLALQRIGNDSVCCIIDGDYYAQVDLPEYANGNNGMRRMSQVFRGQPFYGEVELQNIYRSQIAKVADEM